MLLRLTPNNPFHTVLSEVSSLDSADADMSLYYVHTPGTLLCSTTTISHIVNHDGLVELAAIHRKPFRATMVDYGEKSVASNEFLTHKRFSSG